MPMSPDERLRAQKKAQAYLSAGSAVLGIGALGAMGARAGSTQIAAGINRVGRLKPVKPKAIRRAADRNMGRLTVGSVGLGGVSSANFASVQNQEAKRIKKSFEGVTVMDFGLSSVHQGAAVSSGDVEKSFGSQVRNVARFHGNNAKLIAKPKGSETRIGNARAYARNVGLNASLNPAGTAALGGGAAAATGASVYGASRRRKVAKAFDSEASRKKRLTAYSHGAAAVAGAGGLTGGVLVARGSKQIKSAKSLPKLKVGVRTTGKGAAVTAGALGAGFAAHRINSYKQRGGASYKPRYIHQ